LPGGQFGHTRGAPHESVDGPQSFGEHASGVHCCPGSAHWFGVPPTPHSNGGSHAPQSIIDPQRLSSMPQLSGMSLHVSGMHGHAASFAFA
jgi:hypothetical protein